MPKGKSNPSGSYFGIALIKLMEAQGESLTTLARKTGLTPPYISKLRNDHTNPRQRMRERLAAGLGIPEAYFLIVQAIEKEPEKFKNENAREFLGHRLYDRLYRS
jgi:transcriptional regulator with XRE-family HTH domain